VRLSTRVTWISKFVIPTLLATFFVAGIVMTWLDAHHAGESIVELLAIAPSDGVALGLFLLLMVTSLHDAIRLKDVRRDASGLTVSSGWRTAHIPFSAIAAVHRHRWRPDGAIRLDLREPSPFGHRIFFVPPGIGTRQSHEIAADLTRRITQR